MNARTKAAAWRAAYDLTERQTEVVVALIVARQLGAPLGCEPATSQHLMQGLRISKNSVGDMADLVRMRLVECVAVSSGEHSENWWFATDLAFRRFGLAPPKRVFIGKTAAERVEESAERFEARQRRWVRENRRRLKESA